MNYNISLKSSLSNREWKFHLHVCIEKYHTCMSYVHEEDLKQSITNSPVYTCTCIEEI